MHHHSAETERLAQAILGWAPGDDHNWSDRLLKANFAFVTPTTHAGETVTRFAITNPRTSEADIATILDTMA